MSIKAIMLVIVLAHGGFWFGNRANRVDLTWNLPAPQIPAAEFRWKLAYGKIEITHGSQNLLAGKENASLDLTLPEFHAPADLVLHYDLVRAGGDALQSGDLPLHGVSDDLLKQSGKLVAKRKIVLLDPNEGLSALLKSAAIDHRRIAGLSDLQLTSPDVLIIGQDALGGDLAQDDLLDRARAGTNVVVLAQSKAREAVGYPLGAHSTRAQLASETPHPFVIGFALDDLQAWARESDALRAVELPADEPAHALLYWPSETEGKTPPPIDALLVTRTLEPAKNGQPAGRIIYFQIPISDWRDDPRASMMLANILEYTLTRPQPTLRPSQRTPAATQPTAVPEETLLRM